jgi:hypothetical protein
VNNSRSIIKSAFRQLLGAIIRLAIRNGLNFTEFSNISKSLYVDIATKEYGIKGRETNISRVSLMTGLDRKEIKRIRVMGESQLDAMDKRPDKMATILTNWFTLESYTDQNGLPTELLFDGEGLSFSRLVQEYGGGSLAPITVLREFKRSKAVEETDGGALKVLKKDFIPNYHSNASRSPEMVDPEAIAHGSSMLVDHVNTIFHNLYREDLNQPAQLDMRATSTSIKKSKVKEFYGLADSLGMRVLDEMSEWLEENALDKNDSSAGESIRLGLGVYSIEGENQTIEKRV